MINNLAVGWLDGVLACPNCWSAVLQFEQFSAQISHMAAVKISVLNCSELDLILLEQTLFSWQRLRQIKLNVKTKETDHIVFWRLHSHLCQYFKNIVIAIFWGCRHLFGKKTPLMSSSMDKTKMIGGSVWAPLPRLLDQTEQSKHRSCMFWSGRKGD